MTVNLEPGRALDEGQISAVTHLVSSAVAGLPPGNVTLVDQSGHLLTQSNTSSRDLNDAQLKYASDVEGRVQRRIESILSPIVGNGNVHAQVTAQLDFANKEQTEEQYRPNGDDSRAVLRSRQLNVSEQIGSGAPVAYRAHCLISQHPRIPRQSPTLRLISKMRKPRRRQITAIMPVHAVRSAMKPATMKSTVPFATPK